MKLKRSTPELKFGCAKVATMPSNVIYRVAVPAPLRRSFDYLAADSERPEPGVRLRAPFAGREVVAILLEITDSSDLPKGKLKTVSAVIDMEPVLLPGVLRLMLWAADYYHYAIGEVLQAALPVALRKGRPATAETTTLWSLAKDAQSRDPAQLKRAPLQQRLVTALADSPAGLTDRQLSILAKGWRRPAEQLLARGWLLRSEALQRPAEVHTAVNAVAAPDLNPAQQQAVDAIIKGLGSFQRYLLYGVTGSGKTEVYLRAIEMVLKRNRQVLVLVPEIALTPQLIDRFQARLTVPLAVLHSGLSDQERLQAWLNAKNGTAKVVLGTRSAVMTPIPALGLIIVDEEHDQSYKQQEGFRYHARDLSVIRARDETVPIVLGSATPSLESVHNMEQGQYQLLSLPERTGSAQLPVIQRLDMRRSVANDGLSPTLVEALQHCLQRKEQSLLFLNRRGFSPVFMCHECGWIVPCKRCDARLTFHKNSQRLRCHHCGADQPLVSTCPQCHGQALKPLGEGTERIETTLRKIFPEARIARIDRDSTRRKGALEAILRGMHDGDIDILVGTQMLAKGHDFPAVTLVGILNADQGLYSLDFRAPEYTFQQVMQVSGRAGRSSKPGRVLVQTYHPDHAMFDALEHHDYMAFAKSALQERKATGFPPYSFLALLRVETPQRPTAMQFATNAAEMARQCNSAPSIKISEPMPAPMERVAGRYRIQVLVQAEERKVLHQFLNQWVPLLENSKSGKRVRWNIDRDPINLY